MPAGPPAAPRRNKEMWPRNATHPLQWCHNELDGVLIHRRLDCLLSRLFRRRSKKMQGSESLGFVRGFHQWPVDSLLVVRELTGVPVHAPPPPPPPPPPTHTHTHTQPTHPPHPHPRKGPVTRKKFPIEDVVMHRESESSLNQVMSPVWPHVNTLTNVDISSIE